MNSFVDATGTGSTLSGVDGSDQGRPSRGNVHAVLLQSVDEISNETLHHRDIGIAIERHDGPGTERLSFCVELFAENVPGAVPRLHSTSGTGIHDGGRRQNPSGNLGEVGLDLDSPVGDLLLAFPF